VLLKIANVVLHPIHMVDHHPALNPAVGGVWLVLGKVVFGLAAQQ
jgi:hypothetical protein